MGILDLNPDDYIIKPPSFQKTASASKDASPAKPSPLRSNPNAGSYDSTYSASFLLRNFLPDFDIKRANIDFFEDMLEPDPQAAARDLSTRPSLHWTGVAAVRDREERERNAAKREERGQRHSRLPSEQQWSPALPSPGQGMHTRRGPSGGSIQGMSHSVDGYAGEAMVPDFENHGPSHRQLLPPFPPVPFDVPPSNYGASRPDHEGNGDRGYPSGLKRKLDPDATAGDTLEHARRRRAEIVARCRAEDELLLRDPHDEEALARRAHFLDQLRMEDELVAGRARRIGSSGIHGEPPLPLSGPPPPQSMRIRPPLPPPPPQSMQRGHTPPRYPGPSQSNAPLQAYGGPPVGYGRHPGIDARPPPPQQPTPGSHTNATTPLVLDPRDPRARRNSHDRNGAAQANGSAEAAYGNGAAAKSVPARKKFPKTRFFFLQATLAEAEKAKREGTWLVPHADTQAALSQAFQGGKVFLVLYGPEPGQLLGYAQMEGNLGQGLKPSWMTEQQVQQGASYFPLNYQRPNLFWSEDAKVLMQSVFAQAAETPGLAEMSFDEGSRCLNMIKATRTNSNNVRREQEASGQQQQQPPPSRPPTGLPLPVDMDAISIPKPDGEAAAAATPMEHVMSQEREQVSTPEVPEPAAYVISGSQSSPVVEDAS